MSGEDAIGAGVCMYGPRTTCILSNLIKLSVNEFTLKSLFIKKIIIFNFNLIEKNNNELFWELTKEDMKIEQ